MRDTTRLQQALGLAPPWTVTRSDFDAAAQRLDIYVSSNRQLGPTGLLLDLPRFGGQVSVWVYDT